MISLHLDNSTNTSDNGMTIFYSKNNEEPEESREITSSIANSIDLGHSQMYISTANFFVLREVKCPAVMLNLGYLSNDHDREILLGDKNYKRISEKILEAISDSI